MKSEVEIIAEAKEAAARGDYLAVVRATSGSFQTDLWAAAMTAHFGPTETHACWLDAEGRPSAEAIARFPAIGERMARARELVDNILAHYERQAARRAGAVSP